MHLTAFRGGFLYSNSSKKQNFDTLKSPTKYFRTPQYPEAPMTPNDLLDEVKQRFSILLIDKDEQFHSIMKQALYKYQELAGFTTKRQYNYREIASGVALPQRFSATLAAYDADGKYIYCENWGNTLKFRVVSDTVYPITLAYLEDVLSADFDEYILPAQALSILSDYLQLLIQIPNSERERRVSTAGKLDTTDIPTEADLIARKVDLENQMRMNRAMLPPLGL